MSDSKSQMRINPNFPGVTLHESSYADEGCRIGSGTKIWHFSHILAGAEIGCDCSLGQNVCIGGMAKLGNRVRVQNNVSIYDRVEISDDVFCGPSCVFTNVINPRSFISRKEEYRTTIIDNGASIGANATIVCGVHIGCYAFVGAGSVVTHDVPDYALVYGSPARFKGWICRCGIKLNSNQCSECGIRYQFLDNNSKIKEIV